MQTLSEPDTEVQEPSPGVVVVDGRQFERRLKVAEVAAIMRVSPRLVYNLAAAGKLPCIRHGRMLRFLWSDIQKHELTITTGKI